MEIILLGIYSFFVWLIFIKLKLLPWTTPWKVAVAIFPVVAIAALLLLLNVFAPTTSDVRVVNYVVPIVSQVGAASSRCRWRTTGRSRRATCCSASTRRRTRTKCSRSKRSWRPMRPRSAPIAQRLAEVAGQADRRAVERAAVEASS